jgi:DNA-binding transcriptional regulator WhiA
LPKNDPRYINWRGSLKKRDTGWARGYTKETHPSLAKIAQTFRQKGIDNFKNWREKQRELGLIPSTSKPLQRDKNLAFLMGLVLGDGNISKFPRTECLRITLAEKYPKLITYTKSVIRKVFGKTPNTRKVKGSACYIITMYQNNISGRLGIPIGDRSNFNFCIPDWIFNKRAFLISFLKGLFEAEGSLSIHLPTYTYNFQFSNKNHSLLKCVRESLELLGYHPEVRSVAVRLRKKTEVESFRQLIKFRFC